MKELPQIFVSIASYRDPECQHTVQDLFLKAAHPERIIVGICWQYDPEFDKDCFLTPPPYPEQVRELRYYRQVSKGSCWARAQALSLHGQEEYILQIDAHMRFAPRWDELMLDMLQRCLSEKAVLSTCTFAYTPPEKLQHCEGGVANTFVRALGGLGELQPVHLGGYIRQRKDLLCEGPIPSPFFVGNFLFAPARAVQEVPFDPHIYFRGQELTYSARLWTHGWDIYQPDQTVIYHYWESVGRESAVYKSANERALLARQRVWHLLGFKAAEDPQALAEIEKYAMGNARPLEHYWAFAGVDLQRGVIEEKAKLGLWT